MDRLENILQAYPDLNPDWLLLGKGSMVRSDRLLAVETSSPQGIPLIPFDAFAGIGGGDVSVKDADILHRYVVPDFQGVDFMIRIMGLSMSPTYNSGDIVACRNVTSSTFFQWGRVFVLHHRHQGTIIKRLFPTQEGSTIECRSDHPDFPPFHLSLEEITTIAMVCGSIRLE